MRFRTEIEPISSPVKITHSDKILMLGSCFTDNIGARLMQDGFDVMANPFGPFFNPVSIRNLLVNEPSLFVETDDVCHCLDLPSRFQCTVSEKDSLIRRITTEYNHFKEFATRASIAIITLGSANVYNHISSCRTVANCHKLPATEFCFSHLDLRSTVESVLGIVRRLKEYGVKSIIFTLSPVHHLDKGLQGNFRSKATLRLALEEVLSDDVLYFPAFEIMNDDLRDYRFYAADMKHPSEVAIEYIYSKFAETYFTRATKERAENNFKSWRRNQHRNILQND